MNTNYTLDYTPGLPTVTTISPTFTLPMKAPYPSNFMMPPMQTANTFKQDMLDTNAKNVPPNVNIQPNIPTNVMPTNLGFAPPITEAPAVFNNDLTGTGGNYAYGMAFGMNSKANYMFPTGSSTFFGNEGIGYGAEVSTPTRMNQMLTTINQPEPLIPDTFSDNLTATTYDLNAMLNAEQIKRDIDASTSNDKPDVTERFGPVLNVPAFVDPERKRKKKKKKKHKDKHAKKTVVKVRQKRDETLYPYKCKDCRKRFRYLNSLHKHETVHVPVIAFKCTRCNDVYDTQEELDQHLAGHEETFRCAFCIRIFTKEINLKKHMLNHTEDDLPFKCSQCERIFAQKDPALMLAHIEMHTTRERAFKCQFCEKSFNNRSNMRKHQRLHKTDRPYKCPLCDRRFKQQCNIKPHMLIHSGERPHKCQRCGKGFIQRQQLKLHMYNHDNTRPFKCKRCGWGFNQKGHLRMHTLNCLDRPFKCDECRVSFKYEEAVQKHQDKFHSGNYAATRKHKCHCGCTFKTDVGFVRHKKKFHGEIVRDSFSSSGEDSEVERKPRVKRRRVVKDVKDVKGGGETTDGEVETKPRRRCKRRKARSDSSGSDIPVSVVKKRNPLKKSISESDDGGNDQADDDVNENDANNLNDDDDDDVKMEIVSISLSDLSISDYVDSEVDEEAQNRQIKFEDDSEESAGEILVP